MHRIMEGPSDTMAPVISQPNYDPNVDYIISDYMERLGTRLNILETELKYAWRALDLLSQEYIKMWERLEKLEGLLYEQQSVIAQLLDFYTSGETGQASRLNPDAEGAVLDGRLGELEVIREILGNGTVEDGLEEGVDVTRASQSQGAIIQELDLDMDEIHVPDEAFYRSLNQAYRDDLVCETSRQSSQLGMIWEEREDTEDNEKKADRSNLESNTEIYSALDYKDYRGNSPCVSEQDIAQLTRISTIDHVAIEKLNELDRLSTKLQQDSVNIKQLQRKLLESPHSTEVASDEPLHHIYEDNEKWSFSSGVRDRDELILISKSDIPSTIDNLPYSNRPSSRLSVSDSVIGTDNEVAETLAGGLRTPTSPRRRQIEVTSCSAPYTTVTGRLAYSAAVQNAENAAAAQVVINSKNPFYTNNVELNSLIAASYDAVPCSSPNIFSVKSEKAPSPTLSVCSIRTRQDGYVCSSDNVNAEVTTYTTTSPSPPPPAPKDIFESLIIPGSSTVPEVQTDNTQVFLGSAEAVPTSSIISQEYGRLSPKTPHSPKSPRTSPKRSKSHSSNIVTAKSDSGLSSMSGWSSLEKSPGSPKNGSNRSQLHNFFTDHNIPKINQRSTSPLHLKTDSLHPGSKPYAESDTDTYASNSIQVPVCNSILPGGHHLSAFTTVKSPCSLESIEGYGTFVPAPAPASDINVSPRKKSKHNATKANSFGDYSYRSNQQPAIYSVAGSNRDSYTTVYTSNSADYVTQTMNYPDLIEPYENNELHNRQLLDYAYQNVQTTQPSNTNVEARRASLSRTYSTNVDGLANHEGYKTAMYRTMFPTGNITDALSYYPTSTRYDTSVINLPQADYNDPSMWLNCPPENQYHDSASTSSSMRSTETSEQMYTQSQYTDQRKYSSQSSHRHNEQKPQHVQQPIYENQQQIQQQNYNKSWNQRQEIPYLELDLRNRNVPDYVVQQQQNGDRFYDPSGVIVSQSGYISISSHINDANKEDKPTKKMKRGNTLKSAMNSVSHWFPDLHLTRRHRSYSLPSGSRREGIDDARSMSTKTSTNVTPRKKKKNALVSTMSGILQKAKRKAHNSHSQSLSDPEQSENEWILNRASSAASEGDRSEDSCSVFSENQFESDNLFAKVMTAKPKPRKMSNNESQIIEHNQSQFDSNKHLSPKVPSVTESASKSDQEAELTDNHLGEDEGKSTGSGSSGMFATVGDVKRHSSAPSEKSDESSTSESRTFPQMALCGASMEFAVSRALGKYRQRQTTVSDDQEVFEELNESMAGIDIMQNITVNKSDQPPEVFEHKPAVESLPGNNKNAQNEEAPAAESSPASSFRNHMGRYFPRHQQSLEIPGMRSEDDDNRSTHSWRSGSRVSSRRQSTEDSIDSEDEWYCYELRKLEEMEKHNQLEADMGEPLVEEPEDSFEPCEEVKEKMSFVLRELRMKARTVEGVLDEKENNRQTIISVKAREASRKSSEPNLDFHFVKVAHFQAWEETPAQTGDLEQQPESQETISIKEVIEEEEEERSSGETSGPDSPHLSTDEYDDAEMMIANEFSRCYGTKGDSNEMQQEQQSDNYLATENDVPQIKSDAELKEECSKESGPMGSKWKLLKALKERKAEEKSNLEKVTETTTEKDKVSMMDMMQKFYEIHVKT